MVVAGAETGNRMFKWLHWRRESTRSVAEDAYRIVAKSTERGGLPTDPDPIEELLRIVGDTNADGPSPRRHRPGARRVRARRRS